MARRLWRFPRWKRRVNWNFKTQVYLKLSPRWYRHAGMFCRVSLLEGCILWLMLINQHQNCWKAILYSETYIRASIILQEKKVWGNDEMWFFPLDLTSDRLFVPCSKDGIQFIYSSLSNRGLRNAEGSLRQRSHPKFASIFCRIYSIYFIIS